ncbi:MAG: hypothetical protein Kow00128_02410 [Deltaproteobacteria bacterium]
MIPFFQQPTLHLGPVTIYAFGVLVAAAMLVGSQVVIRRCRRDGLETGLAMDLIFYTLLAGLAGAHLFAVLAYFPGEIRKNPLLLLKFWENISSFGGIAGSVLGIGLFFRWKAPGLPAAVKWRYLEAIAFAFPFGWAIGRLGCTLAHDHPGAITRFPLGVSLATPEAREYIRYYYEAAGRLADLPDGTVLSGMAYHDLGWYEFLYTLLVIIPLFLLLDRRRRPTGFYPALFLLLYAPVRFAFDFLRVSDARYLGLTPGQYGAILAVAAVLLLWRRGIPDRLR